MELLGRLRPRWQPHNWSLSVPMGCPTRPLCRVVRNVFASAALTAVLALRRGLTETLCGPRCGCSAMTCWPDWQLSRQRFDKLAEPTGLHCQYRAQSRVIVESLLVRLRYTWVGFRRRVLGWRLIQVF